MTETEIFVSNKTYSDEWLTDTKSSNPGQYAVIIAIIEVIKDNDGGDITQQEVLLKDPTAEQYIKDEKYKLIPGSGLELWGNGSGIRHAKYSPSKSVAILWENIEGKIYITFDDHAPVKYHRAIVAFQQLRFGKEVWPAHPRTKRKLIEKIEKPHSRKLKGIDLKKRGFI